MVLSVRFDLSHFKEMFEELVRVLKPHGSLLIRTTSNFGIENQVMLLEKVFISCQMVQPDFCLQ